MERLRRLHFARLAKAWPPDEITPWQTDLPPHKVMPRGSLRSPWEKPSSKLCHWHNSPENLARCFDLMCSTDAPNKQQPGVAGTLACPREQNPRLTGPNPRSHGHILPAATAALVRAFRQAAGPPSTRSTSNS
eukprot:365119-Chlamydomonas_euryale.AAC.17